MYLRLDTGERNYLDTRKTNQAVSPQDRIGIFEFWDNLFVECGRLTYALNHFQSSVTSKSEDFFLDLDSESIYYGAPTLSENQFSGIFEPDIGVEPSPYMPALELLGTSKNTVESHPQFYGFVQSAPAAHKHDAVSASPPKREQTKAMQLEDCEAETPRIEAVGSVSELCRFHRKVEAILCAQSAEHAEEFRCVGTLARSLVENFDWSKQMATVVESEGLCDSNWVGVRLTSNCKNPTLPDCYVAKPFHKLWLKALAFEWYSHLNDRRHPLHIAGELWEMLSHHKTLVKQLVKRTKVRLHERNPDNHSKLVIEGTVYQLARKVPGLTPNKAWDRYHEQLMRIGIESAAELKKLCKAVLDRQKP